MRRLDRADLRRRPGRRIDGGSGLELGERRRLRRGLQGVAGASRLTVDTQGSTAVVAFDAAVKAFRAAGCSVDCGGNGCSPAPSDTCDPVTTFCL
jgi:hypothetical protein